MMTVMWRGRKPRRHMQHPYMHHPLRGPTWPATWGRTPPPWKWVWVEAPGRAKPGRGGRRKRRRHQAALRARVRHLRSVARGLPTLRPRMLEMWSRHAFYWTRPETLGRRERRRRAKLRRRRARREARKAARAFLLALPAFYGRPTHWDVSRIAQRKIEQLRCQTSPTLGA